MVFVSLPEMVTSCVCSPYDSCHAVKVYLPGGRFGRVKLPSAPETAKWEFLSTAKELCIQGWMLHFTGMNSGLLNFSEKGGVPGGCDLFHSLLILARG